MTGQDSTGLQPRADGDQRDPRAGHGSALRRSAELPPTVVTARDELVIPALRAAVGRLHPHMHHVVGYHLGWLDVDGYQAGAGGGKALRPALALASAQAAGAAPRQAVPAAAAVECVHNFSLLHDDIMDADTERRHRRTAWAVFGSSSAILAGDALLTLAQEILLEDRLPGCHQAGQRLAQATQQLIRGQAADLALQHCSDISVEQSLTMASDKTAALLACACSIGATLVGAPPELTDELAGFGRHLGLAFQLTDDMLGIWGSPETTGKPVLSDLRAKKKTLPVVAALRTDTASADQLGQLLARPHPLAENEQQLAAHLVEDAGGRQWAESETAHQLDQARQCLHQADMPEPARQQLLDIAQFVTARHN